MPSAETVLCWRVVVVILRKDCRIEYVGLFELGDN